MNRRFGGTIAGLLGVVAATSLMLAGCGKNRAGAILQPSGPPPMPATFGGGLYGRIQFDPVNFPDLASAPFPPARVELFLGDSLLTFDSLAGDRDTFRFSNLPAARYAMRIRTRIFVRDSITPLRVVGSPRLVDDAVLSLRNNGLISGLVSVVGTMANYDSTHAEENFMLQNTLGVYSYPNDLGPGYSIAAGTYRFMFVTDASLGVRRMIGWGGDSTVTLTVPVTNAPARFGQGPAYDIKLHFPTTGLYAFTFDERREVFSVQLIPPGARMAARRIR